MTTTASTVKPQKPRKTHWRFNIEPEVCPNCEGPVYLTRVLVAVHAELEPNENVMVHSWESMTFDQPDHGTGLKENAVALCWKCDQRIPVKLTHRGGDLDGQPYQPRYLLWAREPEMQERLAKQEGRR